ncbi:MAG: hypothetical protein IJ736_15940 [Firmicutes bacterium]|nr:hypothetical protein [Bacillota bacterium]
MKIEIEEFIFEVKDEISCYEEYGKKQAAKWEENFRKWLANDKIKKENVKKEGEKLYYKIEDESEIFDIADEYIESIEENNEEKYWKDFQ